LTNLQPGETPSHHNRQKFQAVYSNSSYTKRALSAFSQLPIIIPTSVWKFIYITQGNHVFGLHWAFKIIIGGGEADPISVPRGNFTPEQPLEIGMNLML
jgi:hypothetical protein